MSHLCPGVFVGNSSQTSSNVVVLTGGNDNPPQPSAHWLKALLSRILLCKPQRQWHQHVVYIMNTYEYILSFLSDLVFVKRSNSIPSFDVLVKTSSFGGEENNCLHMWQSWFCRLKSNGLFFFIWSSIVTSVTSARVDSYFQYALTCFPPSYLYGHLTVVRWTMQHACCSYVVRISHHSFISNIMYDPPKCFH